MATTREELRQLFGDIVTVRDRTKTESQGQASFSPHENDQRAKNY